MRVQTSVLRGQRRSYRLPELPWGAGNGPRSEQSVLLTAEPSLQLVNSVLSSEKYGFACLFCLINLRQVLALLSRMAWNFDHS